MKKCVHVDSQFYPHDRTAEIETLKEHGIELVMAKIQKGDDEGFIKACEGADAVIVCYADANRNVLSHLPDLKIVVRTGVGFENVDVDAATDYNIAACNIPHFCTQEVAVTACTHILNCVRRVSYENKLVHEGGWMVSTEGYPYVRLSTQKLGLVGFGKIARTVASYMAGFGLPIMAYDPYLPDEVFAQAGVKRVSLDELCAQADIISVHVPHSDATHHMIGKEQFALMHDGVYIVNTSRGGLIDQQALCDALDSGKVRAAGLDVLEEEPPTEATAKILSYENVCITPHRAAQSPESWIDMVDQVIESVIIGIDGTLPANALNRKALAQKRGRQE